MGDTPVFMLAGCNRNDGKNKEKFIKDAKADILATLKFLYDRGMWSKFHYDKWSAEAKAMENEEMIHLWWDSIVQGAMFEIESPLEERMEGEAELSFLMPHPPPNKT